MPDQQIDLLGIRCEDLMQAARKWFGEEKGHGFARDIHKTAVRDGLFRPEDLGAGRRTSNIWRANTRLHLPEVAALDHEPSEHFSHHSSEGLQ